MRTIVIGPLDVVRYTVKTRPIETPIGIVVDAACNQVEVHGNTYQINSEDWGKWPAYRATDMATCEVVELVFSEDWLCEFA